MSKKRILNPEKEFQVVHVVLKATGKGHSNDSWIFDLGQRKKLIYEMKRFLGLFRGIQVIGFTVMSNHLHALFRISRDHKASRKQVAQYYFECYGHKIHPNSSKCFKLSKELNNISKFIQRFARDFACKFNRECQFKRTGHLWAERFHSTLIEDGGALLKCWKYIIFNPVKAEMTATPLDYKFNSLTFEDKNWCKECMNELYQTYLYLTDDAHGLSMEQFVEMINEIICEEVQKWETLSKEKKVEYRENLHFWDKASAVGNENYLAKIQRIFHMKYHIHKTDSPDLNWL